MTNIDKFMNISISSISKILGISINNLSEFMGHSVSTYVFEDFTTYTEVDGGNDITISPNNIINFDTMRNDALSYVLKDRGVNQISGDWIYEFDSEFTSIDDGAEVCIWGISQKYVTIGNQKSQSDGYHIEFRRDGNTYYTELYDNETSQSDSYSEGSLPGKRWYTVNRASSVLTCYIYSNSSKTTLVDTLVITGANTQDNRYEIPLATQFLPGSSSAATGNTGNWVIS
jgi:hypothetical protein